MVLKRILLRIYKLIKFNYELVFLKTNYVKEINLYEKINLFIKEVLPETNLMFIDIGANDGQSANLVFNLFRNLVEVNIIEPAPSDKLLNQINFWNYNHKGILTKFYQIAIGCSNQIVLIENTYSGLNSILELNDSYKYPHQGDQSNRKLVKCQSLDETLLEIKNNNSNSQDLIKILKIDTQGYEYKIVKDSKLLNDGFIDLLIIEVIMVDKYKGQGKYYEIMSHLESLGFIILDFEVAYREFMGRQVDKASFGQTNELDLLMVHYSSVLAKSLKQNL